MLPNLLTFMDSHGAGVAAFAAVVGIPFLIWQIAQGAWQENRRIKARRLAALSTLPMTLNAISHWAKQAAQSQLTIYQWAKGDKQGAQPAYQPPPSPYDLVEGIERMIEAAPRERTAATLTAIVAKVQVLWARLSAMEEFAPACIEGQKFSVDDNLLFAASIYSLAGSLYGDARKLSEGVPDDFGEMKSALLILKIYDGTYDETHALLARRAQKRDLQRRRGYQKLRDAAVSSWKRRRSTTPVVPRPPE